MRKLVAILGAFCLAAAPALATAQTPAPTVILLHPGLDPPASEAIVIPAGSPVKLVAFPRDHESTAKFSGRFELTGTYQVEGYGEDALVTLWPDKASLARLPYWNDRGGAEELYLANGWAFAEAVVARGELKKLKAETVESVSGRATIIADDYETSIECDVAHFSARFVSLVNTLEVAGAEPGSEGEC